MLDKVNVRSKTAVFLQIENWVQFAVSSGKLSEGDQLPSVRELSEKLGVNPNTIAKAYRDLEVLGLVYARRGMGVFIKDGATKRCKENITANVLGRLHQVIAEAKASGLSKKDLQEFLNTSFHLADDPYGELPKQVARFSSSKK